MVDGIMWIKDGLKVIETGGFSFMKPYPNNLTLDDPVNWMGLVWSFIDLI